MEKLRSYQGFSGQFSEWKSNARAKYDNWKEDHGNESLVDIGGNLAKNSSGNESENDYSHIYRSANETFHGVTFRRTLYYSIFRSIIENRYKELCDSIDKLNPPQSLLT